MTEKLPLMIHRFYTKYVDEFVRDEKSGRMVPTGKKRARDMVEYGPIGQATRTQCTAPIEILSKIPADAGANPAVAMAAARWEFIKPRYEAWKNNQELPAEGTPLGAWNHLTSEQAEVLRVNGIRSVEDVSILTDTHIQRIPIPNLRSIIEAAKRFLSATDSNRISSELKQKDDLIAALTARVDELAGMVAKPKRGRPPKVVEAA